MAISERSILQQQLAMPATTGTVVCDSDNNVTRLRPLLEQAAVFRAHLFIHQFAITCSSCFLRHFAHKDILRDNDGCSSSESIKFMAAVVVDDRCSQPVRVTVLLPLQLPAT